MCSWQYDLNARAHRRAAAMVAQGAMLLARPRGANCSTSLQISASGNLCEYVQQPSRPNVGHRHAVDLSNSFPYFRSIGRAHLREIQQIRFVANHVITRQKIENLPHELAGQLPELLDSFRRRKRNLLTPEATPCDPFAVVAHLRDVGRVMADN